MTTLPQTVRHDQVQEGSRSRANGHANGHPNGQGGPSGSTLPALSSMPVLSSPVSLPATAGGEGGGGAGLTGNDVMRVLRENLLLIIVMAILSGIAGYALNLWLAENYISYRAEGAVLVKQPDAEMFDPTGEGEGLLRQRSESLDVLLQTQAAGLKNPEMIADLVEKNERIRESSWLNKVAGGQAPGQLDSPKAVEELLTSFNASPVRGSQLINVSFSADNPRDAIEFLNTITNTRMEDLRQLSSRELDETIAELRRIVNTRRDEIADLDRRIRQTQGDGAGEGEVAGTTAALRMQLTEAITSQREAEFQASLLETQLQMAEQAIRSGNDPAAVETFVQNNPDVQRTEAQITQLQQELAVQEGQLGEKHPQIVSMRRRLDALQSDLADRVADARATARGQVITGLETQFQAARDRADQLAIEAKRFDERLDQVQRTAADLATLRDDRESKANELERLTTRLDLLERQSILRPTQTMQWYKRPTPPRSPDFPRLPLTIAGCLLLGVGGFIGFAFLREILDTSVKSPRDVIRGGNMTVLGTIPDESDDPEASGKDKPLALAIAHSPHSMTAEQYRMVRSRLAHVAPLESTRSILVTSPQPGDGKTTVACNLAGGLALNGRSVLLVDANFRRPGIHEVFGIANDKGFSTALQDPDAFDDCVFAVENVPNLHVLPSGPKPDKGTATELIENNGFLDVLDRAFEGYDVVVFDSGPILFTSETGALAPQVDGVISVVRARSSTRGLLGRLRDSLASLNVEHLGVVLNAVRSRAGGYYTRNIKTYYDYQKVPARR